MVGMPEEEIRAYFYQPLDGDPLKPYNYAFDPCFNKLIPLMQRYQRAGPPLEKYNFNGETRERPSIGKTAADIESEAKGCSNGRSLRYLWEMAANKNFDPTKARTVGQEVINRFTEKAILAGHDLVIMEGNLFAVQDAHSALVKKACSSGGEKLKEKIEAASTRIRDFKTANAKRLLERSSQEWINANRADLEKVFFEIYPALNDPQAPCESQNLKRAQSILKKLCDAR
jgi:hypothetical protein